MGNMVIDIATMNMYYDMNRTYTYIINRSIENDYRITIINSGIEISHENVKSKIGGK